MQRECTGQRPWLWLWFVACFPSFGPVRIWSCHLNFEFSTSLEEFGVFWPELQRRKNSCQLPAACRFPIWSAWYSKTWTWCLQPPEEREWLGVPPLPWDAWGSWSPECLLIFEATRFGLFSSAKSLASVGHWRAWMHMAMVGVMCLTTAGPPVPLSRWARFYTQADESLGSPSSQDPMMTVDGLIHRSTFVVPFRLPTQAALQSGCAHFCIRCGWSFLRPHLLPQMYSGLEFSSCGTRADTYTSNLLPPFATLHSEWGPSSIDCVHW